MFSSYGDNHEVVIVEDIAKEGAFDEAVKGVDAIAHTASPFHLKADSPDELIIPAVKGAVGMLQSALKYGTNVQRVVVTGSCVAVSSPGILVPRTFTEEDWNGPSVKEVQEKGRNADPMSIYRASKTLAEKAVWDFVEQNKSLIQWDVCVLNPPYVFGPAIHELTSPEQLNQSLADFYKIVIKGEVTNMDSLIHGGSSWVDVRDLGLAHSLALEKEAAGGQRIIVSSGPHIWQEWILSANALNPPIYENLFKGNATYDPKIHQSLFNYDTAKSDRILGLKYRTKDETAKDVMADFKLNRNW